MPVGTSRRACLFPREVTALPLQKNQIIPLTITGTTALGSGVGRFVSEEYPGGFVVFVPQTAVGDEIDCRILRVEKQHAFGKVAHIRTPSPDRLPSVDCPVFGQCGGCAWRHVTYEAELRYKAQHVADCMKRIGGIEVSCDPIVGCEQADGYRNKAQYPVAAGEEGVRVGFFAPRSHRLIEQRDCRLQPQVFREILDKIAAWADEYAVSIYDETTGQGLLRHIYIRQAEATGQLMTCLVCTSGKLPHVPELLGSLTAVPGMTSIMVNVNARDTNVVLGDREFTLWGQDAITDILCGRHIRLSPRSFYQVNRRQAQRLYTIAADAAHLSGTETLLDLYCGTGTIGLSMADRVKTLIGVEIVPAAVEDARRNAEQNGIANARFLCADAGRAAAQLAAEGVQPDVVILDPPRKGCDLALIQTVAQRMSPHKIVYVSCAPATLARDLGEFARLGYETARITPVDMFPRTAHVETVVLMTKKQPNRSL